MNKISLKYPIVLVHGFLAKDSGSQNSWGGLPEYLRNKGNKVFFGNQKAMATIEENAQILTENIKKIAEEIKEIYQKIKKEKRTLIVNSSGGSFKTGIIVYCLLRMSGEQRDNALKILLNLKGEYRNGFGDLRVESAEKKVVPLLIEDELI